MRGTCVALVCIIAVGCAFAGGPLIVGGPRVGTDGQPITWDPARMPITYRVDAGPLSQTPGGQVVIDNAAGVARVQNLFQIWANVSTAKISFNYAGPLIAAGAYTGGDVKTSAQFSAVEKSCDDGVQNPVVFDADGSIFDDVIGDPTVVGFAGPCGIDSQGHIASAEAVLNGRFQDGVSSATNGELTSDLFDAVFIHEFGHFIGLDHSQINANCMTSCTGDDLAGLPTMFPVLLDDSMKTLAADDIAWVSKLYPAGSFATNYGVITGTVYFPDGVTPAQGVNVIARNVDDPMTTQDESRVYAVSVVSGYRFTGNPGQSVTATYLPCSPKDKCPNGYSGNNAGGSNFGSRSPALYGYFEIPVPPGTYTVEVESILPGFTAGSSVGPLRPPTAMPGGIPKYWNANSSAADDPATSTPVTVPAAGTVNNVNIILNGSDSPHDAFEGAWLWWPRFGPIKDDACRERG